jgi:hypothetical protein
MALLATKKLVETEDDDEARKYSLTLASSDDRSLYGVAITDSAASKTGKSHQTVHSFTSVDSFDASPYRPGVITNDSSLFHPDGREHNFYSQWFHVRNAFDLCKEYCLKKNSLFDVVIKYRSEIQPEIILEISDVQPNRFYCPVHPAYQTNDQMAYGDFHMMEAYSRLVNFYEFFYTNKMLLYSGGIPRPTECVLFDYLNILAHYDKIDVIYIDFKFYLGGCGK